MYRSIVISFLAGSMMAIFSGSAQAQKAPEPAASNLNLSKSNRVQSPVDPSGIAVNDPGMPAEKSKPKTGNKAAHGNKAGIQ